MPESKSFPVRPDSKKPSSMVMSSALTGRRNARLANVPIISDAHAGSSSLVDGRQVKICSRLGESPRPVTLYGPRNSTLAIPGGIVESPAYS